METLPEIAFGNALDAGILAILALVALRGSFRGLVAELFGIAGWLVGGVAAVILAVPLAPRTSELTGLPVALGEAVAGLAVFYSVLLASRLAGWLVRIAMRSLVPSVLDRISGALFGAVKGVVLVTLILLVFDSRRGAPDISGRIAGSFIASRLVPIGWAVMAEARSLVGEVDIEKLLDVVGPPDPSGPSDPSDLADPDAPEPIPGAIPSPTVTL